MMKAGFTLIEILVVTAIMVLLVGLGLASFLQFNDRQQVSTSMEETKIFIRSAQTKAKNGAINDTVVAANCGTLYAYRVTNSSCAGGADLCTYALCKRCVGAICGTSSHLVESLNLENVTITSSVNLSFRALYGDAGSYDFDLNNWTWLAAPQEIIINLDSYNYTFSVNKGGEISEGVMN